VYLLFGGLLLVLVVSAMRETLANAPSREAAAELEPYGLVAIRFSTDPNPPLPTGTVGLIFTLADDRRRPVTVDRAQFEYGMQGSNQPLGSSEAQPMGEGSGMLMGQAQFPQVGTWWLRFKMAKGSSQAEVRFTFYVEPAQ
jgi:hypothetical protein